MKTDPTWLRLPAEGSKCPVTGLTRSFLNSLVLACGKNDYQPKVRSLVVRKRGAKRGIRLIDFSSLKAFIRSFESDDVRTN